MKELSLHILDIMQNSIEADANQIILKIKEKIDKNLLKIIIEDDGKGIKDEDINRVVDPFITSRTTREVGLGLSLLKSSAIMCGGDLKINSTKGKGTKIAADFEYDHIDRPPLGDIPETITTVIAANPELDIIYEHRVEGEQFVFATKEIKKELDDVKISHPKILNWINSFIKENLGKLPGGEF